MQISVEHLGQETETGGAGVGLRLGRSKRESMRGRLFFFAAAMRRGDMKAEQVGIGQ